MEESRSGSASRCPICGSTDTRIESKAAKFDVKKAVVAGVLTGGIGAVAGFAGYLKNHDFTICNSCGFSAGHNFETAPLQLKEKQLQLIREPLQYEHDIPFPQIVNAIMQNAKGDDVVLAWRNGEIVSGSVITRQYAPCIVLFHPLHADDYLNLCICKTTFGRRCKYSVCSFGKSTQLGIAEYADQVSVFSGIGLQGVALGALRGGDTGTNFALGSLGFGIGRGAVVAAKKGLNALQADSNALEQEKFWYALVSDVVDSVLHG